MTPDKTAALTPPETRQAYGTIVVVGGGCYGTYYVRQLRRARENNALTFERLVVVDHDENCAVANEQAADVDMRIADWTAFFAEYLAGETNENDAIVPSPLMPHLLFEWLEQRARLRFPERHVSIEAPGEIAAMPWQKAGGDSNRYVSYATWMCPVNCIEPRICPHTRELRSWSMPPGITAHVAAARASGERLDGPAIFHCAHRAYGVGMIDVRDVLAVEQMLGSPLRLLVGTVSHCHGALGVLVVA